MVVDILHPFYRRNFISFEDNLIEISMFVLYTIAAIGQAISSGD